MRLPRASWLGVSLAVLSACSADDCPVVGAQECSSPTETARCAEVDEKLGVGQSRQWVTSPCENGTFCELVAGTAFCSPTATAVPQCAGESASGFPFRTACWENKLLPCMGAFLLIPTGGLAGAACSGACVEANDASCAFCSSTDAAAVSDPACDEGTGSICEGNIGYRCGCGFRTDEVADCTDGGFCVIGNAFPLAFCASSRTPDPQCMELGTEGSYCGDGGIVQCKSGFDVSFTPCSCQAPFVGCSPVSEAGRD